MLHQRSDARRVQVPHRRDGCRHPDATTVAAFRKAMPPDRALDLRPRGEARRARPDRVVACAFRTTEDGGGFSYQSIKPVVTGDGDILRWLDVLHGRRRHGRLLRRARDHDLHRQLRRRAVGRRSIGPQGREGDETGHRAVEVGPFRPRGCHPDTTVAARLNRAGAPIQARCPTAAARRGERPGDHPSHVRARPTRTSGMRIDGLRLARVIVAGRRSPRDAGAPARARAPAGDHTKCWPPLMVSVEPFTNPASSLARYSTAWAISSASPRRPVGMVEMILLRISSGTAITISVAM